MQSKSLAFAEYDHGQQVMSFSEFPVFNVFSTVLAGEQFGNMSRRWAKEAGDEAAADRNVAAFFELVGISAKNRVHMIPGVGNMIKVVTEKNITDIVAGGGTFKCDGLATTMINIPLTLCPADCLPVILGSADPNYQFCCLLHVSKKSLEIEIIHIGVEAVHMLQHGISTSRIVAAIGPGIGPCCYDKLDLREEARKQLQEYGLAEGNIFADDKICTCCSRLPGSEEYIFPSHRRAENCGHEGRFLALACL